VERIEGVVVSGAGPVGLVIALRLARAGIRVLVLEAEAGIADQPRAVVYHSPVVERLAALGLLPDLQQIGVLKHAYHYWTRDHVLLGHIDMGVLRPEDTAYPYNLHLGQPMLAQIILHHLLSVPGAEVRWRHRVNAVAQSTDHVTVTVATDEGEKTLQAPWLVGADGTHSGVRRALQLSYAGITWPEWFVATNVRFDFEAHGFGQSNIVLDPEHWAIIPKIDRTGLWRCTYRDDPAEVEEVRRRLPDRYALFAPGLADCMPEAVSPYRVHDRCVETFRVGRALLAGDAAHVVNPVGGLGLTSGLLDAVSLGDALVAVLEGTRSDRVLDAYAAERRRVFMEIVSPAAKENRRRVGERDPDKRRADVARLRHLTENAEAARQALLGVFQIVGRNPLTMSG
jgi:2-polyprenyl-6-methoxyphenol hydroxylase-like FAD-dependent oxidoreductase